jgi:hypothetical protein
MRRIVFNITSILLQDEIGWHHYHSIYYSRYNIAYTTAQQFQLCVPLPNCIFGKLLNKKGKIDHPEKRWVFDFQYIYNLKKGYPKLAWFFLVYWPPKLTFL